MTISATNKLLICLLCLFSWSSCNDQSEKVLIPQDLNGEGLSGAGLAMDQWMAMRSFPNGELDINAYSKAFQQKKLQQYTRDGVVTNWEAIGPKNIGGRTLCLAFHPEDPDIIFAGSAGGGLWKTTTAGLGYTGWVPVPTGFPVIGVSTIAIDPNNADVMYIGTGEVYNYEAAAPGEVNRITRGSYGIGILKSEDGGQTWFPSLDWSLGEMKGVQEVVINPENSNMILAATTEGLLRSYDAGNSWTDLDDNMMMAVDIEFSPADTNIILLSYGNMNSPDRGVYRSFDGSNSFAPVALVNNYTGKTMLAFSPSDPNIVYASVANEFSGMGLYRSNNSGITWALLNTTDVPKYQGWYAHDLAVNPNDPDHLVYVGVDSWLSNDGGQTLSQKSFWDAWFFGQVPVGGPEGPEVYVHADIHAAYYHPNDPNNVYLATDGGIFVSFDNGNTFEGRNGSYQTQQFYANFSNSSTDSLFAIGGMQDNSTAYYTGDDAWTRVIGGDGMSTAINSENDDIVYGTYQNLNIRKSTNGGENFSSNVTPPGSGNEYRAFNGAYELAPSNQSILYAGTTTIYRSDDDGDNWYKPSPSNVDGTNIIFNIAISPNDPDLLYVSTAPNTFINNNQPPGHVFKSVDGGANWVVMSGLPDHTVSDIAFHPAKPEVVFLTYSGFGVNHVWLTQDGGQNWEERGNDLPDVPTNAIVVDTTFGTNLYVGNDLGVYWSQNGGLNWDLLSDELPDAVMVMDVTISVPNNKLRIATHGSGIWQTDLQFPVDINEVISSESWALKVVPNPVVNQAYVQFDVKEELKTLSMSLYDSGGRLLKESVEGERMKGKQEIEVEVSDYAAGIYYVVLRGLTRTGKTIKLTKSISIN